MRYFGEITCGSLNKISRRLNDCAQLSWGDCNVKKVAVLEWISGGGLRHVPPEEIPASLLAEGTGMLRCLVEELASAGQKVCLALDDRFATQQFELPESGETISIDQNRSTPASSIPSGWLDLAQACEMTIVVAPELDNALTKVIQGLTQAGGRLFNCQSPLLNVASDKRLTAEALHANNIPHPATALLRDLDDPSNLDKLRGLANESGSSRWCVKPCDGAGCEAIQRFDSLEDLLRHIRLTGPAGNTNARLGSYLIQPWLEGEPYSCSAIVDRHGTAHWLPLVTQEIDFMILDEESSVNSCERPCYRGGKVASEALQQRRPVNLLNQTLDALCNHQVTGIPRIAESAAFGWVSFDLLYRSDDQSWTVIEVNPRFTTSVVTLADSYPGQLGQAWIDAFLGGEIRLDSWPVFD